MKISLYLIAVCTFLCTPVLTHAYSTYSNSYSNVYDDGCVRVVDNTRSNSHSYSQVHSHTHTHDTTYPYVSPNTAKRATTRYVAPKSHTRTYAQPVKRTVVQLRGDQYCDWVTHYDTYFDGVRWVDNERIVRECDQSDAYTRYYGRDARKNSRYTTNSYNNYDSYYRTDGVQQFNTYGW